MASLLKITPVRPVSVAETPRSAPPRGACLITHSYPAQGPQVEAVTRSASLLDYCDISVPSFARGTSCSGSAVTGHSLRFGQGTDHTTL